MATQTILRVENLTKRFTGVVANDAVNFDVREREIHAIIGENGAGKSTLCKMLTGIYKPDGGSIYLFGKKVTFKSAAEAMRAGIGMVYQERNNVGYLDGAHNVCLGHEPVNGIFLNPKKIRAKAEEIKKNLQVDVPLDVPVEKLGAGEQQLIEIMRAFFLNPKLLVLDEPTASLGLSEVEPFIKFIKKLAHQMGISVIFISHKIEEVFQVADRITVFTDGRSVCTNITTETTMNECIAAMIKKGKIDPIVVPTKDTDKLEKVLEVETLTFDRKKRDLGFNTRLGEVVGIYGLVGSGRTETMEAIFGIRPADDRHFVFAGHKIHKEDFNEMIRRGMVMTPERRGNGIFAGLSVQDNICNLFLKKLSTKIGFLKFGQSRKFALNVLKKNEVKYTSLTQDISGLSGGNMQKVVIGRSIEVEKLKLLILDEPTAGLDLGAKHEIYLKMRKLADEDHKSVIFISSELDELIATCDRIYTFFSGNVTKEFKRKDFDKMEIISNVLKGGSNGREQAASGA
jgi:ABC-type sugar transport system ATPase subunit